MLTGLPRFLIGFWHFDLLSNPTYDVRNYRTTEPGDFMDNVSVNKFRDNLKSYVEQIAENHTPLKVTRRTGEDFVVISAEDWEREQETLHVLQNKNLMGQIADSVETHTRKKGYNPSKEELSEITGL